MTKALRINEYIFNNVSMLLLDFDGVLTTNSVLVLENGSEAVLCSRYDGIGIAKLNSIGIETVIVSTEENRVVRARAKKLKLRCFQGIKEKGKIVKKLIADAKVDAKTVVFVGNDINDLPALELVGIPIVVNDCWPELLSVAKAITNRNGGMGAVREICDKIYDDFVKIDQSGLK